MTFALIRVESSSVVSELADCLRNWFVPKSFTVSHVLDGAAVVASDFRTDPAGHLHITVFASARNGAGRIVRVVPRLCEIELSKKMVMLGFF